jgi:hypothetical protein
MATRTVFAQIFTPVWRGKVSFFEFGGNFFILVQYALTRVFNILQNTCQTHAQVAVA